MYIEKLIETYGLDQKNFNPFYEETSIMQEEPTGTADALSLDPHESPEYPKLPEDNYMINLTGAGRFEPESPDQYV